MIKDALTIVFLLFAVWGICDLICFLRVFLFMPKSHFKSFNVLFLSDGSALEQLRFVWEKFRWHGNEFADIIIAFYDNISIQELDECKRFCAGKNIVLTSSGESYSKWKTLI